MSLHTQPDAAAKPNISVRPLQENDLSKADQIMRLAFGTFLGVPDPATVFGDASFVRTRWETNPNAAFAAEINHEIVGSNFATNWGSVSFFGPLTVRPDCWDSGVGTRLMEPVLASFDQWKTRHAGLFTFAHSPKHICFYQKFGFYPRFLTAMMARPVKHNVGHFQWTKFSDAPSGERTAIINAARQLTDTIYDGLDVTSEIQAVADQALGDTVLLWHNSQLIGLAVCHYGAGTEAGSGACYVKFGATRPDSDVELNFGNLLAACEAMALSQNLSHIIAGMNTARHEAYRLMLDHGFRINFSGVGMDKPNEAGYNRSGVYVIDDWR